MTEDEIAGWHHRLDGHELPLRREIFALWGMEPPQLQKPVGVSKFANSDNLGWRIKVSMTRNFYVL